MVISCDVNKVVFRFASLLFSSSQPRPTEVTTYILVFFFVCVFVYFSIFLSHQLDDCTYT